MSTAKIKKGDTVKVIAGKDESYDGKVLEVKDGKVKVEGRNMITKHTKPSVANQQGGIVNQEGYIDISNVMYVHNGKPTRIGFTYVDKDGNRSNFKTKDNKKVRVAKATDEIID